MMQLRSLTTLKLIQKVKEIQDEDSKEYVDQLEEEKLEVEAQ